MLTSLLSLMSLPPRDGFSDIIRRQSNNVRACVLSIVMFSNSVDGIHIYPFKYEYLHKKYSMK